MVWIEDGDDKIKFKWLLFYNDSMVSFIELSWLISKVILIV